MIFVQGKLGIELGLVEVIGQFFGQPCGEAGRGFRGGVVFPGGIAVIVIRVDAFIHPGIAAFVGAEDAIEPIMADLVFDCQVQFFVCGFIGGFLRRFAGRGS